MTDQSKDVLYSACKGSVDQELKFTLGQPLERKKTLYGVCGEGMDHAIRSGVIINHLQEKNEVTTFAHGRSYHYLLEKFDNVYQIEGFNTIYESNQVNSAKTFIYNIKDLPQDLLNNLTSMYDVAKAFEPHIIISDFEFYTNL